MKSEKQFTKTDEEKTLFRAYSIFLLTFLVLCIAAFAAYKVQNDLIQSTEIANKHTNFPVRLEELVASLKDSETGLRGFLVSNDSVFLQSYSRAEFRTDSILNILKDYLKLGVIDENAFNTLQNLSHRVLSIQKADLRNSFLDQDLDLKIGKSQMDSLQAIVKTIKIQGIRKVTEYRSAQTASIKKQPFYLLFILVMALSIFVVAAYFILKFIRNLTTTQTALTHKIEEIERYNRELDQYNFTLTHHLQEPLRKVRIFLNRFQEKNKAFFTVPMNRDEAQGFKGIQIEPLRKVDEAATQAQLYLNQFLYYTKLMRHEDMLSENVYLNKIIQEVLTENEARIKALNATITVAEMPVLKGNTHYIKVLWTHLIDNALKYTLPNVPPVIEIDYYVEDLPLAHISISDNGRGFHNVHKEKIFELFQRLEKDKDGQNLGIGLALCRRIVEGHGGRIDAESIEQRGTTFHIYLPKA